MSLCVRSESPSTRGADQARERAPRTEISNPILRATALTSSSGSSSELASRSFSKCHRVGPDGHQQIRVWCERSGLFQKKKKRGRGVVTAGTPTAIDPETAGLEQAVDRLEVLDDITSCVEEEARDAHVPGALGGQSRRSGNASERQLTGVSWLSPRTSRRRLGMASTRTGCVTVYLEEIAGGEGKVGRPSGDVVRVNVRKVTRGEEVLSRADVAQRVQVRVERYRVGFRSVVQDVGRGDELRGSRAVPRVQFCSSGASRGRSTGPLTMCNENSFAWQEKPASPGPQYRVSGGVFSTSLRGNFHTDLGGRSPTPSGRVLRPARGREPRL